MSLSFFGIPCINTHYVLFYRFRRLSIEAEVYRSAHEACIELWLTLVGLIRILRVL
jgi:hypothetical protein